MSVPRCDEQMVGCTMTKIQTVNLFMSKSRMELQYVYNDRQMFRLQRLKRGQGNSVELAINH